jgi:hypothetical protein
VTDLVLAPYLIIGAVMSVPLSAITVRRIKTGRLRFGIGVITVVLGISTLWKIVLK